MSEKEWSEVNYSSVPGSAMRRYSRAFAKQDSKRFDEWKTDKTTKASVSATYPHEVLACDDSALADKLWDNLPDLLSIYIKYLSDLSNILSFKNCDIP